MGNALPTTVLKHTGTFLVLSAYAIMMSSIGSAADLRVRIDATAARHTTTPSPKSRKQLFEEFLELKKQQSR